MAGTEHGSKQGINAESDHGTDWSDSTVRPSTDSIVLLRVSVSNVDVITPPDSLKRGVDSTVSQASA